MENAKQVTPVLKNVRLAFQSLLVPSAVKDTAGNAIGELKYNCKILVSKSDAANLAVIKAELERAFKEAVSNPKKWAGVTPTNYLKPFIDGDNPGEGIQPREEQKGHYVINLKSKNKPRLVGRDRKDITDVNEIYSGMYINVSFNFYGWLFMNKYGIGAGLGNVQKAGEGEPFSSRSRVEDDFEILPYDGEADDAIFSM